jgi:PST family polysaccharide transporter
VRILITQKIGLAYNGIYEAVYTFSLLFLPVLSNLLWSYSYAEYCCAKNDKELSEAVNRFLKLSLTIAFPIIIFLILARSILIEKIIFTNEFNPAVQLLPARLLVDFLTIALWSFNVVLLAKDRLKVGVELEIIRDVFLLAGVAYIISNHKLGGVLMVEILTSLLFIIMSYIYIKKQFAFHLSKNNFYLLLSSVLIICFVGVLPVNNIPSIIGSVIISSLWFAIFSPFVEIKEAVKSFRKF